MPKSFLILVLTLLPLSGCSHWQELNSKQQGAVIGAGVGAVIGSVISAPIGTIIGGVGGALAGGVLGQESTKTGRHH